MELDWLKEYLEREGVDVDASLTTFAGEADEDVDPEAWLSWLKDTDVLTPDQFASAHAADPVHTTVPGLLTWGDDDTHAESTATPVVRRPGVRKLGLVGKGGMAAVHVARQEDLLRKVAYKVMAPNVSGSPVLVRRFLAEAQITAQLEHPNIVPVYGLEPEEGAGFAYSMKLIDGLTLEEVLERSARARGEGGEVPPDLTLPALLEHFLKVCDAIDYAHGKGVVHRDLKPANIMIGPHREVYVMDWGLARVMAERDPEDTVELDGGDAAKTRVGAILGTPMYMSPEQARGQTAVVGPASDQYSLGLLLYEMVCGRSARARMEGTAVVQVAQRGKLRPMEPPGPRERIAPELEAIVRKASALGPGDRYRSVAALADDVRRYLANEEVEALPDTPARKASRWLSRHREATLRLVIGLVALIGFVSAAAVTKVYLDGVAAEAREEQLSDFLSTVGSQAKDIDTHFAEMEARVEGIVGGARHLLMHGQPVEGPVFFAEDFFDPATRPPDASYSPFYGWVMSTSWPDASHPPSLPREVAEERVRRLMPIRHELLRAQLETGTEGLDRDAAIAQWRGEGGPVMWALIGLTDGILLEVPGNAWDTKGYDPRVRPWYQLGDQAGGPHWGNPFKEAGADRLLLPCSMAVRDDAGALLGVASVMTEFNWVIDHHMKVPEGAEAWLVAGDGRVMLSTSVRDAAIGSSRLDESYETPPFPEPEVVAAMVGREAGHVEVGGRMYGWQRLHVQDWSYVVAVDELAR